LNRDDVFISFIKWGIHFIAEGSGTLLPIPSKTYFTFDTNLQISSFIFQAIPGYKIPPSKRCPVLLKGFSLNEKNIRILCETRKNDIEYSPIM